MGKTVDETKKEFINNSERRWSKGFRETPTTRRFVPHLLDRSTSKSRRTMGDRNKWRFDLVRITIKPRRRRSEPEKTNALGREEKRFLYKKQDESFKSMRDDLRMRWGQFEERVLLYCERRESGGTSPNQIFGNFGAETSGLFRSINRLPSAL